MLTNISLSGKYGLIVCTDRTLTMRYKARVQIPQKKLLVVQFKLLAFFFSHSVHKTEKKKVEVNFRNTPTSWLGGQSRRNGQMTALTDDKVLKLQFIMSNVRYSSLRKQPTFCNSTTGFLTKRHLRNKCRIFILMMSH